MNTVKAKHTIYCNTCGCSLKRTKSIKVNADTKEKALIEANEKLNLWVCSLEGQNCKVCMSILNDLAA